MRSPNNGKNKLMASFLFLILIAGVQAQDLQSPLTEQERQLADQINQYRQENGLPAIPVTNSLTEVARAHVSDLNAYHPDTATYGTGDCNRHSWSDHGDWTAVCYTGSAQSSQMWNKPREITDSYRGNGYEIAYWCSSQATPASAMAEWKSSSYHSDTILERGSFAIVDWKAIGVAIKGNYAVAWFGEDEDPAGEVSADSHAVAYDGLTLSVRKETYAPGETVQFVLKKETPGSSSLVGARYDIEKEVSGQWKPYFKMDADQWHFKTPEIGPGLNKGFTWDQRQKGDPDNKASAGRYRVKFYAPEAFEGSIIMEFAIEPRR